MDGKKVVSAGFEVILPRYEDRPAEERRWQERARIKVIEMNDAARQRAAFKRILRYSSLFATNEPTVA
jgi:hypothetical protein